MASAQGPDVADQRRERRRTLPERPRGDGPQDAASILAERMRFAASVYPANKLRIALVAVMLLGLPKEVVAFEPVQANATSPR